MAFNWGRLTEDEMVLEVKEGLALLPDSRFFDVVLDAAREQTNGIEELQLACEAVLKEEQEKEEGDG